MNCYQQNAEETLDKMFSYDVILHNLQEVSLYLV